MGSYDAGQHCPFIGDEWTAVARCLRFYGGGPREWLDLDAQSLMTFLHRIPQLQAEEAIHQSIVYSLGAGLLKPEDRTRQVNQWKRIAAGDRKPEPRTLASMLPPGIGMR